MAFNEMRRQRLNSGVSEENARRHNQPALRFGQKVNFSISQKIAVLNHIDSAFECPLETDTTYTVRGHGYADSVGLIYCSLDLLFREVARNPLRATERSGDENLDEVRP